MSENIEYMCNGLFACGLNYPIGWITLITLAIFTVTLYYLYFKWLD
jgi:hypothetical protein